MRVAVVRPQQTWRDLGRRLAVGLVLLAFYAWLLMLIAGTLTDWHLSYWHTVLGLVGLRLVQNTSGYLSWTHPAGKQ
jgi:hypothetical protein